MMLSLALAQSEGDILLSSTQLAEGAGTNPTLVRRLLPLLSKAGLISVTKGREGGVRLARPAREVTLDTIYRAIVGDEPLWTARENVPHRCLVSNNISSFFGRLTREAEEALLLSLSRRDLAESLEELRRIETCALPGR
ncbi:Rrf2 family transcriptional regulator [Bradyrhizobium lablabi]|uniref:Rrf2 family transcriptional regulator n=1 Tax=Bradyrhizobium lablabi TaxID=722472 RepID=UPI001BA6A77A|nr:Rrf2 family transcriptional regulator [Bradyrhizobium lablabi]